MANNKTGSTWAAVAQMGTPEQRPKSQENSASAHRRQNSSAPIAILKARTVARQAAQAPSSLEQRPRSLGAEGEVLRAEVVALRAEAAALRLEKESRDAESSSSIPATCSQSNSDETTWASNNPVPQNTPEDSSDEMTPSSSSQSRGYQASQLLALQQVVNELIRLRDEDIQEACAKIDAAEARTAYAFQRAKETEVMARQWLDDADRRVDAAWESTERLKHSLVVRDVEVQWAGFWIRAKERTNQVLREENRALQEKYDKLKCAAKKLGLEQSA